MVDILSEKLVSPIVNKDCSITFNIKSENAKKVEIDGDLKLGREMVGARTTPVPMKKTDNSLWTFTTEPVIPGI